MEIYLRIDATEISIHSVPQNGEEIRVRFNDIDLQIYLDVPRAKALLKLLTYSLKLYAVENE